MGRFHHFTIRINPIIFILDLHSFFVIYYDCGKEEYGYSFLAGSVLTRPCFCAFPVIATEHPLCRFDEEPGIDPDILTFQGVNDHPFLTACKGTCSMSTQANKVLVRRYREAHNTNNLALLDEVVAADIKSHSGMPGLSSGLDGGKMVHRRFLAAFSDGHVTTEDLIAEGDQVVERFFPSEAQTQVRSCMHPPPVRRGRFQECAFSASQTAV